MPVEYRSGLSFQDGEASMISATDINYIDPEDLRRRSLTPRTANASNGAANA